MSESPRGTQGLGAQLRHEAGMASSALSPLVSHLCEGGSLGNSICLGLQGQKPIARFVPVEAMMLGAFNVLRGSGTMGRRPPSVQGPAQPPHNGPSVIPGEDLAQGCRDLCSDRAVSSLDSPGISILG